MAINIKKILKDILKSLGMFILGGIAGVIILFVFFLERIFAGISTDIGIGILALAPILIILYSILSFVLGGFSGLILYWAYRFWKHKKK